jgi:hypothetical protein
MRAVAIDFTGGYTTCINFRREVSGKSLQEQKYLINVATKAGSDPVFPKRGTKLLDSAIGGALMSINGLTDGFAAVDTVYFCNYEESKAMYESPDNVRAFTLTPTQVGSSLTEVCFTANFLFADQTETKVPITVANNG